MTKTLENKSNFSVAHGRSVQIGKETHGPGAIVSLPASEAEHLIVAGFLRHHQADVKNPQAEHDAEEPQIRLVTLRDTGDNLANIGYQHATE